MSYRRLMFSVLGGAAATGGLVGLLIAVITPADTRPRDGTPSAFGRPTAPDATPYASYDNLKMARDMALQAQRQATAQYGPQPVSYDKAVNDYAAANGGMVSLRAMGAIAHSYAMTHQSFRADEGAGGYHSSSGTRYKYDLSNPSDQALYEADAAAQARDSANPRVQLDREMGQYGGGAER